MRKIIAVLVTSTMLLFSCANEPKEAQVKTSANAPVDSFYLIENPNDGFSLGLYATINGKVISIVDTTKHLYMIIDSVLDYDQDKDLDVLMVYSESGGGNCCPNTYFLITNNGNGKFTRSQMTEPSYHAPKFEQWKGQNTLIVKTSDAGADGDDYKETIVRYAIENGQVKKIESIVTKEIPAIAEIKASEFASSEEIRDLIFDLDSDGTADTIRCSVWERWNLLVPEFIFANGSICDKTELSAKRIGVLESKTNGLNDLVFNLDWIYKWDGKVYKSVREEEW